MPVHPDDEVIISRGNTLMEAETGREMVALHVESGTCFGFNPTAYRIWQLIEQPVSLTRLCDALSREFAVAPSECRGDVRAMLDDLARDGIVKLAPAH